LRFRCSLRRRSLRGFELVIRDRREFPQSAACCLVTPSSARVGARSVASDDRPSNLPPAPRPAGGLALFC
jgi:hypothetical protein